LKKFLALVAAMVPTAAFAADATVYPAPTHHHESLYSPTAVHDWTGLYVGGSLGYVSGTVTGPTTGGLSGVDVDVHVQYNFQSGNWVFGPFVAIPLPTASATVVVPVKIDWALVAGGRLGYAMDRWLPYVIAGGIVGGGSASSFSATHTGYTLGLGLEYAVSDRWTVGGRYAYVSMGAQPYGGLGSYGWDAHSIAATLNVKLD
jgi:outer membrane immunogenic protein